MLATGYLYDLLRKLGLSDFGARSGEFLVLRPLKVLLVVLGAVLVGRVAARAVRRGVRSLQLRTPLRGLTARAEQRAATTAEVLASLARALIWFVAVLIIFDQLGINLAPLLAGAGIAGIAVGFGAQSLVKDVISGLFIFVEDQFGVGDSVDLGDTTGTVEDVNLRVTRVRALDGKVWFVPNGEIRRVGNSSLEWSRAVVDIFVPRSTEVTGAIDAISEEAAALAAEPAWGEVIVEPPEVWGVESLTPEGMTIRVVAKTAAQRQAAVARALRARLTARLQRDAAASGRAKR